MGYRLRIILLSIGVLLGFGGAFAHFSHAHDYRHAYRDGPCRQAGPHGHWRWEAE